MQIHVHGGEISPAEQQAYVSHVREQNPGRDIDDLEGGHRELADELQPPFHVDGRQVDQQAFLFKAYHGDLLLFLLPGVLVSDLGAAASAIKSHSRQMVAPGDVFP